MLQREAKLLEKLTHHNIVRLEAHIEDKQYEYFIFELCKGGTLKSLMEKHKTLPIGVIRFYAMELILALEALQEKKIVHRDIKPANILLDNTFHIILTDFGTAKEIDEEEVYADLRFVDFEKPR